MRGCFRLAGWLIAASLTLTFVRGAQAAWEPTKPVEIVVPAGVGDGKQVADGVVQISGHCGCSCRRILHGYAHHAGIETADRHQPVVQRGGRQDGLSAVIGLCSIGLGCKDLLGDGY